MRQGCPSRFGSFSELSQDQPEIRLGDYETRSDTRPKIKVPKRSGSHRRRLAEPDPPPKRLTVREERAALRALLVLPPSEKG